MAIYSLLAEFVTEWNMMMAFSILASAPLVVAFIFLQRYFVRGMTVGAIKQRAGDGTWTRGPPRRRLRSTSSASDRTRARPPRRHRRPSAPDTKSPLRQFEVQGGGMIATAMVACARLGLRARYIGKFGDDYWARLGRRLLLRDGVDRPRTRSGRAAASATSA